jgi:predicted amidohydrolase YtcJ
VLAGIRKCVRANPDAPFIRGEGWYVTLFPEGIPHEKILDEIDSSRSLYFQSADGHSLWVNSRALEAIGVAKDTPDPHGGRIERDPATNEPLGVFQKDAAIEMAWKHTPYSDEEIESGLRYAAKYLNSLGITSVQDAIVKRDSNDPYGSLEACRKLNESGELTSAQCWHSVSAGRGERPPPALSPGNRRGRARACSLPHRSRAARRSSRQ